MCRYCRKEYVDPMDRRFHAQTIACGHCGPKVYLTDNDGDRVKSEDPIRDASRLLDEGYVVAIKGNGGFHIASATTRDDPIVRLRRAKHRAQKPFAIMARDLETIKSFAYVNVKEAELLESYVKPIVLLRKREDFRLSDLIAPELFNIGVMLPYTGLHIMLFEHTKEPAFIMTSGNPPDEPIATGNSEALKKLGPEVDFFLFHDREIAQRCDDSVVRVVGKNTMMIRRSRGYAPAPIYVEAKVDGCVLGVGGELNVTCCLLTQKKAFLSQHIGDIETPDTLQFLKHTIRHVSRLTRSEITCVACDLHPGFQTTRLAFEIGEKNELPVIKVQHHHAHIAKLMAENNVDEVVGIACDGFGYGQDGKAWGGEILHCSSNRYDRIGHLQEHLMPGGDLATKYPLRMVASILYGVEGIGDLLSSKAAYFPHAEKEIEIVLTELERKKGPRTSSCGRVLDAVSALLGICYSRTYEGEPAMKLESVAVYGSDVLKLQPRIRGEILDTRFLLEEVYRRRDSLPAADLACSAQSYLARGLAELAALGAERIGVRAIGFSGGVAYNEHIALTIRDYVQERGFRFIMHNRVPPGDAGISFGQAIVASKT
jgi:hydrogenase maturation protein HypF